MASGPLNIGDKGTFGSRQYTVAGYALIGMYEEGVLYTWHEYAIEADDGNEATLEYDEGKWLFMVDYTPKLAPNASELNSMRPGSSLNVDGTRLQVTQAEGCVLREVEGKYDLAFPGETQWRYLDAKSPGKVWAAEWSKGQVNWVQGRILGHADVCRAFGKSIATYVEDDDDDTGVYYGGGHSRHSYPAISPGTAKGFIHTGFALAVACVIAFSIWAVMGSGTVVKSEAMTLPAGDATPHQVTVASTSSTTYSWYRPAVPQSVDLVSKTYRFSTVKLDPDENGYLLEVFSNDSRTDSDISGRLVPPGSQAAGTIDARNPHDLGATSLKSYQPSAELEFKAKAQSEYAVEISVGKAAPSTTIGYKLTSGRKSRGWLLAYTILGALGCIVALLVGFTNR